MMHEIAKAALVSAFNEARYQAECAEDVSQGAERRARLAAEELKDAVANLTALRETLKELGIAEPEQQTSAAFIGGVGRGLAACNQASAASLPVRSLGYGKA